MVETGTSPQLRGNVVHDHVAGTGRRVALIRSPWLLSIDLRASSKVAARRSMRVCVASLSFSIGRHRDPSRKSVIFRYPRRLRGQKARAKRGAQVVSDVGPKLGADRPAQPEGLAAESKRARTIRRRTPTEGPAGARSRRTRHSPHHRCEGVSETDGATCARVDDDRVVGRAGRADGPRLRLGRRCAAQISVEAARCTTYPAGVGERGAGDEVADDDDEAGPGMNTGEGERRGLAGQRGGKTEDTHGEVAAGAGTEVRMVSPPAVARTLDRQRCQERVRTGQCGHSESRSLAQA